MSENKGQEFKPVVKKTLADEHGEIMEFELPPVTEQSGDFIDDEEPQTPEGEFNPEPQEAKTGEDYRGTQDDKGKPYDPALHVYPPEKTATGRWKKIPKSQREQVEHVEANAGYRREAQKLSALYAGLHIMAFGREHGSPDSPDDLLPMTDSFERYMLENGKVDIPPALDVAFSCGLYSFDVAIQREPNRVKVARALAPITNWVKKLFGIKEKEKQEETE